MFRFEHSTYLYALALIPLLGLIFVWARYVRKRYLKRLGELNLLDRLMPGFSRYRHGLKLVILLLGVTFLILGWANPQWGTQRKSVERESADIYFALDISNSMNAQDIMPSRLARARNLAVKLMQGLSGERMGLVLFAGNAYLQVPLTTDYGALKLFFESANSDLAPTQGTAIDAVIELVRENRDSEADQQCILIIISDGEDHEGKARAAAAAAAEEGVIVFTIGVGTEAGSFVPVNVNGGIGYKRDRMGNPVRSQLDPQTLKTIAQAGRGEYFQLGNNETAIADRLRARIDRLEKQTFETRGFEEYESYFQYFIGIALILLVLEFLLAYRKSGVLSDRDWFNE